MSVQTQIDRLEAAKAALVSAITAKGVAVPAPVLLDDLAGYVEKIQAKTVSGSSVGTFERVMRGQLVDIRL